MRANRRSIVIAVVLLAVSALAIWRWSTPSPPAAPERSAEGYYVWTIQHLKTGLARKDFVLVNVHVPFEGRIANTDLEIPYEKIDQALNKLPKEKGSKIVLYCRSGRMSDIAARRLAELGFTNVASVQGGMLAWEESGGKLLQK